MHPGKSQWEQRQDWGSLCRGAGRECAVGTQWVRKDSKGTPVRHPLPSRAKGPLRALTTRQCEVNGAGSPVGQGRVGAGAAAQL